MTDPNRSARVGDLAPWPKGRRRNDPRPPKPYQTMAEFWQALHSRLQLRGAKTQLAAAISVDRKTLHKWLTGDCVPSQQFVTAIGKWLRKSQKNISQVVGSGQR